MARKELTFTAEDGRDQGKRYQLREMPASQAERWAIRVILAIGKAGIEIPEGLASQGMAGLAAVGLMSLPRIPFTDAEPLLEEMMACVQRIESAITRPLVEDDIEEVSTRFKLRKAVFELHTGFFGSADASTSESGAAAETGNTLNIKMPHKQ
jgi:hypothetical protein